MRLFKLFLVLVLFILISCKPVAYYNTPNDVFEKDGIVYMLSGIERKGKISVLFETGRESDKSIHLKNGDNDEKILVDSIQSYLLNGNSYFPKIVALDFDGNERLLFVKRLTKENSRIQLYELYQPRNKTSDGSDFTAYYVSLPGHSRLETWLVGSKHLVPNFDEKMSKIVEDCATLSNKIKQKDKGYFVSQLTLSVAKVETMKRIIDEYDDCL